MLPTWDPSENENSLYSPIQYHSPGMISFRYEPKPSQEILDLINSLLKK